MYTKRNSTKLKTDSHLVEVHLFCVEHTIKQTMVMLTRTSYGHCEEVGPAPPWRCSRRVCPATSALTTDSHRNRRFYHVAPCRTPTIYATATSINTFSLKRINTHIYIHHCSIQERCRLYFLWSSKQKTYNTKVVWNSVVKLLGKENFKRRLVCDEFDKIWSNRFQTKLKLTPNETRNGWSVWIYLVEVHLFHVGHMFQWSIVVIL
jgi:hypothetical protein